MKYKARRQVPLAEGLYRRRFRRVIIVLSFAFLCLHFFQTSTFCVPACPNPALLRQPDGTTFRARKVGDEHGHATETDTGYTIIKEAGTGSWFYAIKNEEERLEKSPFLVGKILPGEAGIRKHLRSSDFHRKKSIFPREGAKSASLSSPYGAKGTPHVSAAKTGQPTWATDVIKNLVILARFSDHTTLFTRNDFDALFNETGYSADGACGSVRDYYREASHSRAQIDSTVTDWVVLPYDEAYYGANGPRGTDLRRREMAKDAIQALDDTGFDLSPYDGDGDGYVDMLTIIHSGLGEEYAGNPKECIWSHMATLWPQVAVDGVIISQYCTASERRWSNTSIVRIGVICHEMGHLLDLPDLYDTDFSSSGIGVWGVMAAGSWGGDMYSAQRPVHFCAWSKKQLGWLIPTELDSSHSSLTVTQIEETTWPVVYKISHEMAGGEYLLIENRQKRSYDANLPSGGLLIWHIDGNKPDNDDEKDHYMVALLQADGKGDLENGSDRGDAGDPFPGTNGNRSLTPDTNPNSGSYFNGDTNIWITNISDPAEVMTFRLTLGGPPPVNEPPKISITSLSQRKDGSGHLDVAFTGVDADEDRASWVSSDCLFAPYPYTQWETLSFDTADSGHTADEPMAFTSEGTSFVAVIDASAWNGLYRIKLQVSDGADNSIPVVSNEFSVDNTPAEVSVATHVEGTAPQSGESSVILNSCWTDPNLYETWFCLKLNGDEWCTSVAGSPEGESSQSAACNSLTLDGDDYLTFKSYHVDELGNESSESVSAPYYVIPMIPSTPQVGAPTPNSLVVAVVPNPDETADVHYAVWCPTVEKYVDYATGVFGDSPIWGNHSQWNGDAGVKVVGLSSKTTYSFRTMASNPLHHPAKSDFSGAASAATTNTPPNTPQAVSLFPQSPTTADALVCLVTPADPPDADPQDVVSYIYTWSCPGKENIISGPKSVFSDTIPSAETAKGDRWTCTVVATDGEAFSGEVSDSATIVNSLPTIEVTGDLIVYQFSSVDLSVEATDADGDYLTLSCEGAPAGAIFIDAGGGTGTFEWLPTTVGTYDGIRFIADDGEGQTVHPVSITVAPIPFRIVYIGLEPLIGERETLAIMWFGIPGATYSVFRSENLIAWELVGSGISLPPGSEQGDWLSYHEEMNDPLRPSYFYRVGMQ